MDIGAIFRGVKQALLEMCSNFIPKGAPSCDDCRVLGRVGIKVSAYKIRKVRPLRWEPSLSYAFTLNTDGSSVQGQCTGGGIVRDGQGAFIAAFSNYYGAGTNMKAEILAMRDGLQLCRDLQLWSVQVFSDSMVAVKTVQGIYSYNWLHTYELRDCMELSRGYHLQHVLREANGVADHLPTNAHVHQEQRRYEDCRYVPRDVLIALKFDESGQYKIRR